MDLALLLHEPGKRALAMSKVLLPPLEVLP